MIDVAGNVFSIASTIALSSWLLLAGWVHDLAFDLLIGAAVVFRRQVRSTPRVKL